MSTAASATSAETKTAVTAAETKPAAPAVSTKAPSILERLKVSNTEKVELQRQADASKQDLAAANDKIAELTQANADLTTRNADLDQAAGTLTADLDAANIKIAALEKNKTTVSKGVAETVATTIGVNLNALPAQQENGGIDAPKSAEDYVKAISAENDPEKKKKLHASYRAAFPLTASARRN